MSEYTSDYTGYEPMPNPDSILARSNRILYDKTYFPASGDLFFLGMDTFTLIQGIKNWEEERMSHSHEVGLNFCSRDLGGRISIGYREDENGQTCEMQIVHNAGIATPIVFINRLSDGTFSRTLIDTYSQDIITEEDSGIFPLGFSESRNIIRFLRDGVAQHILAGPD